MGKLAGLFLIFLCSSFAYATPSVSFKYALNGQGEPQLKVRGQDLCDSESFRIRVTSDITGDSGWYTSETGNTQWKVNSRACNLDMFLARKYLVPGYTLEVRTYALGGRRLHSFSATIPCEETQWVTTFSDGWIYETAIASPISCQAPGQPLPPAPVQPPLPPSCDAHVAVNQVRPDLVSVSVSCSQSLGVNVSVTGANRSVLCENPRFAADTTEALVCTLNRDRTHRLDYKVNVTGMNYGPLLGSTEGFLPKDATYNYPPQGQLLSDRFVQPPTQSKAFGRGQYWDVSIKAVVSDSDVDPSEGLALIKVDLIEMVNGVEHILTSKYSNSDQPVQFDLEHQFINPKVFGKPHESGDLHRGHNTLKLRVWDAYQGQSKVDLPEVTVVIPN